MLLDGAKVGVSRRVGNQPDGADPVHGVTVRRAAFHDRLGWVSLAQTRNSNSLQRFVGHGRDIYIEQGVAGKRLGNMPLDNLTCHARGRIEMLPPFFYQRERNGGNADRKSTRLNSSHVKISYAVFC